DRHSTRADVEAPWPVARRDLEVRADVRAEEPAALADPRPFPQRAVDLRARPLRCHSGSFDMSVKYANTSAGAPAMSTVRSKLGTRSAASGTAVEPGLGAPANDIPDLLEETRAVGLQLVGYELARGPLLHAPFLLRLGLARRTHTRHVSPPLRGRCERHFPKCRGVARAGTTEPQCTSGARV